MIALEAVMEDRLDLVVVVGDVNATLAAALVAAKLHLPLVHVEPGLHSFDCTMPPLWDGHAAERIADD